MSSTAQFWSPSFHPLLRAAASGWRVLWSFFLTAEGSVIIPWCHLDLIQRAELFPPAHRAPDGSGKLGGGEEAGRPCCRIWGCGGLLGMAFSSGEAKGSCATSLLLDLVPLPSPSSIPPAATYHTATTTVCLHATSSVVPRSRAGLWNVLPSRYGLENGASLTPLF